MQGLKATIRPVREVESLEEKWRTLERHVQPSFFLGWDWAATAIETSEDTLLVVEIFSGSDVVALGLLAPMVEKRHGVLTIRQLRLNETGHDSAHTVPIEYNSLLAAPEHQSACWNALLLALNQADAPLWDELIVSNALEGVESGLSQKGFAIHRRAEMGSGLVDLEKLRSDGVDTYAAYVGTLGKSTRQQLNRSIKQYEARGPISLDKAATLETAESYLQEIINQHNAKWGALGKESQAVSAHNIDFQRRLIKRTLAQGGVELVRISAGGDPFAWVYNYIEAKRVLYIMGGFKVEDDQRLKPGLVAHAVLIASHINAGRDVYDFLAGDGRYKLNLGQAGPDFTSFAIQRPTLALRAEKTLRGLKQRFAPAKKTG